MNNEFEIKPYESVGVLKFGMSIEDVKNIFNVEPDFEYIDPVLKITTLGWENIKVRFNKKKQVEEISFVEGMFRAVLNNNDLLADLDLSKTLGKTEKPYNTVGFKVYFELGVAITGFSKKKDDKTITIFSKQLIADWKS